MNDEEPRDISKPDAETLANRKAGMEMALDAAMRGDGICGGMFALEHIAEQSGLYLGVDYSEDDWDDVQPF